MKLWMIVYLAGQIVGSIGPLPYGMDECVLRADDQMSALDHSIITEEGYTAEDVGFSCEWRDEHPRLRSGVVQGLT